MNELVEKLLQPVSAEQPCGPDLSDDPRFDALVSLAKGKPEVEVGSVKKPAEPPDWRKLREESTAFLGQSKNLRVAVMFCCSAIQTTGLVGLRDGLDLIRGLVEQYWPAVHPLLDPEDNNDPTQRLNILGTLAAPRGSIRPDIQQWLAVVDYLYTVPLVRAKGVLPVTMEMVVAARNRVETKTEEPPAEGAPPPVLGYDLAQIGQALRAAPPAEFEASQAAVTETLAALEGLDQFLTQQLGSGETISFEELSKVLKEVAAVFTSYAPGATEEQGGAGLEGVGVDGATGGTAGGGTGGIAISGSIRSREDVVRVIDAICDYYRQAEPSSAVPYLLRRVQKMARMNFLEAVQELNVATPDTLRPSMGSAVDSDPLTR